MKKSDLVEKIVEAGNLSKKDAELALNTTFESIIEAVANGDKVQITGFGTFEPRERKARTGVNPRSGEKMEIEASKVPAFKAGKAFKDLVNL